MATVKNWQLGRTMEYPYDARFPSRQFAFVFNINRCIACQSCTMACKSTWTFNKGQEHMWWANVETKPYGGYPQWWDAKILGKLEDSNPGGQIWGGKPADGRFAPAGRSGPSLCPPHAAWAPPTARALQSTRDACGSEGALAAAARAAFPAAGGSCASPRSCPEDAGHE